jgi:hypothetical protein
MFTAIIKDKNITLKGLELLQYLGVGWVWTISV